MSILYDPSCSLVVVVDPFAGPQYCRVDDAYMERKKRSRPDSNWGYWKV